MSYGIQNLKKRARFDMLTPGSSDEDERGYNQQSRPSNPNPYDPEQGDVTEASPKQPVGLIKVANTQSADDDDSDARLRQMIGTIQDTYHPDTYSRDRNNRLLDSFPERGQPTKMDRFTAAMLSVGQKDPADITEKVLQAPYYRARDEWKEKADPYYKAAQLEQQGNNQERQIIGNAVTGFSAAERTAQAQRKANQQYELGVQRNELLKFKQDHPDWDIDLTGPTGWATNPQNPNQRINLGPTGHLSDLEKLNIQGRTARDVAGIRAGATRDAASIRANATGGGAGARGKQIYVDSAGVNFTTGGNGYVDIEGKPYVPKGDIEKISTAREPVDNASNQARDYENRLIRTHNNTEAGRKYIYNDGKQWMIKPRPKQGLWGDASAEMAEYDAMMKSIDPTYVSPDQSTTPKPQGTNLPGGPIAHPPGDGTLRSKAADLLTKNGKPVTQANIDWVIKQGKVK